MPALPAVNDVIRVALIGTLGSDTNVVNRLYLQHFGTVGTSAALQTFCNAIATAWGADVCPNMPSTYSLHSVTAEDLTSSTAPTAVIATSHVGTRSGNALAAGQAAVVKFHIPRRYRGGHPRMYLSAFSNTDLLTAQTWQSASTTALVSGFQTFIAAAKVALGTWSGGAGGEHVNVSYYQGFTNVTYPSGRTRAVAKLRLAPVVDLVESYSANPNVASQRRRNQTP